MNRLCRIAASALLASLSILSLGASVKDLPVKSVNGHLYHYYEVPSKETVYSICNKLGVTKAELVSNNPSVKDGIKAGMILYFPYDGDPTVTKAADSAPAPATTTHRVERGETIFGISHKYGIMESQLIEANPALKNGLKAGQVIIIPAGENVTTVRDVAQVTPAVTPVASAPEMPDALEGYLVKKNETLYSIAMAHGLTVADLEKVNPGLRTLKQGQIINIPVARSERVAPSTPAASNETADAVEEPAVEPGVVETVEESVAETTVRERPVSVAVLLPFMLGEETPSKTAQRATEFYKGFLLAVDSLRSSSRPITVSAYDTEGSLVKVKEIIADTAFSRHTAIVAPDNAAQLALIAEYGRNNNVAVFNPFVVKDESYVTNPVMMQGNLPSEMMYDKAVSAYVERLRHSTPVFLTLAGSPGEKTEFVNQLKSKLGAENIEWIELSAEEKFTAEDLKPLDTDGNYTFIPTTGRQADLNRMMPAVIAWRDEAVLPTVRFFGYPEWIMFRGETLTNMQNLNTTVYSRFSADYDCRACEDVEAKFKYWYGGAMESVVPRQGLMGFDAGMFLIPYMSDGRTTYDGVQNGYRFVSAGADGAGMYNDLLYLINFRPSGLTEKTPL